MSGMSSSRINEVLDHITQYPHFYYTTLVDPTFVFDYDEYKAYIVK